MRATENLYQDLKPSIHPAYARLLVAHVRSHGVDVDALFSGNSLTWQGLMESPVFVSYEQFNLLLKRAQALSGVDSLELEISNIIEASAHGPLGYGAVAAPNLRATFALVAEMLATRINIIEITLTEDEVYAHFRLDTLMDLRELKSFVLMMLLGSFLDLINKTIGGIFEPITVKLPFDGLEKQEEYERKYPSINFTLQHDCLEIILPVSLMDQACFTADDFAYRNAVRECKQLIEQSGKGGSMARKVKDYLLLQSPEFPTLTQSADHFAASERTLIRKLKAEGTSYQELLDEVRKELVVWLLNDGRLSVEEVATKVGYSDSSNFSRVFRRWFDMTPSEYREILSV